MKMYRYMKNNNTNLQIILIFLLALFATTSFAQNEYRVGDIITFPDGAKGVVCYVDPNNAKKGWAVAPNDLPGQYALCFSTPGALFSSRPTPLAVDGTTFDYTKWEFEGKKNTLILLESGSSPAADAVDFYNGWYIPDLVQLRTILSVTPLIQSAFNILGGNNMFDALSTNIFWSSSCVGYSLRLIGMSNRGESVVTENGAQQFRIRPVRDFGYDAEAYWLDPYLTDSIKTGSMEVSPEVTTTYDAVVVFGQDTFPLTGTVLVHENFKSDTLYEVVCQSSEPYNSTKSSLFTDLDISTPTIAYDTFSVNAHTIFGCDSIVTLLLKVVSDCENFYYDSICPIHEGESFTSRYGFGPFGPGTISQVIEYPGQKTVTTESGTITIDTVAYYELTVMPEYQIPDELHLCLGEESAVIPYEGNEHVTITVTSGHIALEAEAGYGIEIDSTDKVHGNFVIIMKTEFGCDSLINLHIDNSEVKRDTLHRKDLFYLNTAECVDQIIGEQDGSAFYLPLVNNTNYSCTQMIYTQEEVGSTRPISTISFHYASSAAMTAKTDVKIYMAHTDKDYFTANNDWLSPSNMILVYDGELNCTTRME